MYPNLTTLPILSFIFEINYQQLFLNNNLNLPFSYKAFIQCVWFETAVLFSELEIISEFIAL